MKKFLLLLALVAANTGGCKPEVRHKAPEVLGERTNEQGEVTHRIVREISYTVGNIPVLTPDGPRRRAENQVKYFMDEKGKPRRELPVMFLVNTNAGNYEKCWPVVGTSQWLVAGTDPIGNRDKLFFVLFDESRIIRTNVFSVIPRWKSEKSEYELQDGNRTMMIRSPEGFEKYDVLAGTADKVEK
ncbi:MAG: hypothetical protein JWR69_1960 [Pedosphaera sp.]|nr:hypothetical protein [Pedosphaera sp.]